MIRDSLLVAALCLAGCGAQSIQTPTVESFEEKGERPSVRALDYERHLEGVEHQQRSLEHLQRDLERIDTQLQRVEEEL